jgi:hypothetical protein
LKTAAIAAVFYGAAEGARHVFARLIKDNSGFYVEAATATNSF